MNDINEQNSVPQDAEQNAQPHVPQTIQQNAPQDNLRTYIMVIYGLYALAILVGVSALIGVIVAYVKRDDMRGTAYECHIDYLIKTFWYGLAVLVVGWITSFILIGLLVLFAGYIWFTYRVVAGFIKFNDGKAVDPNGWL